MILNSEGVLPLLLSPQFPSLFPPSSEFLGSQKHGSLAPIPPPPPPPPPSLSGSIKISFLLPPLVPPSLQSDYWKNGIKFHHSLLFHSRNKQRAARSRNLFSRKSNNMGRKMGFIQKNRPTSTGGTLRFGHWWGPLERE